jgi:NAD-dependent deacetylase
MGTTLSTAEQARLSELCVEAQGGLILVLTGAGISAESGIPTFRGPEGYWTLGSREYHPMELATRATFQRLPDDVWSWYLYRRSVCRASAPNPAHDALVRLERALADNFLLVTQNVDGLHVRAGNSATRTYEVHGNIDWMRCERGCRSSLLSVPEFLNDWPKVRRISDTDRDLLRCPACGSRARPHVLWFDESYDEANYKWRSSIAAAEKASLLLVVGTSGATHLPERIVRTVAARSRPSIVANLEPSPFSEIAEASPKGLALKGKAGDLVPTVVEALLRGVSSPAAS